MKPMIKQSQREWLRPSYAAGLVIVIVAATARLGLRSLGRIFTSGESRCSVSPQSRSTEKPTLLASGTHAGTGRASRTFVVALVAVLVVAAVSGQRIRPDGVGPPTPTDTLLAATALLLDHSGIDGALRLALGTPARSNNDSYLEIGLNVPDGQTVEWAVLISIAGSDVRIQPGAPLGTETSGRLPPGVTLKNVSVGSAVHTFLIAGSITGPKKGYDELLASPGDVFGSGGVTTVGLRSDALLARKLNGSYASIVVLPSFTGLAPIRRSSPFIFDSPAAMSAIEVLEWSQSYAARDYRGFQVVQMPPGFTPQSGLPPQSFANNWQWRTDEIPASARALTFASNLELINLSSRNSFYSGLLFGLAGSCVVALLQLAASPGLRSILSISRRPPRSAADSHQATESPDPSVPIGDGGDDAGARPLSPPTIRTGSG